MTKISNQYSLTNVLFADAVNGRVGIGTASPTVPLDVVGAGKFSTTVTAQTGFKLPANGNGTSPTLAYNNSLGFGVSGTGIFFGNLYNSDLSTAMQLRVTNSGGTDITAMTIEPSGSSVFNANVFVRANDRGYSVQHSDGTYNAGLGNVNGSNLKTGYMYLNQNGSTTVQLIANGSSFLNGGNVGIGNSNPTFKLDVNGEIVTRGAATAAYSYEDRNNTSIIYAMFAYNGYTNFYNGGNKAQINMSNGVYTALSDINKKKDFEQSNIGLNEVMQLKPTLYRMKTDDGSSAKELGFIAQEVKELIPQAYVENKSQDDVFIGLNQMPLIAALTKAIQEQQTQINELKALLNA